MWAFVVTLLTFVIGGTLGWLCVEWFMSALDD